MDKSIEFTQEELIGLEENLNDTIKLGDDSELVRPLHEKIHDAAQNM